MQLVHGASLAKRRRIARQPKESVKMCETGEDVLAIKVGARGSAQEAALHKRTATWQRQSEYEYTKASGIDGGNELLQNDFMGSSSPKRSGQVGVNSAPELEAQCGCEGRSCTTKRPVSS